jgi:hypothetical protein
VGKGAPLQYFRGCQIPRAVPTRARPTFDRVGKSL